MSGGFKFNKKNTRDVALINDCDSGVRELAKELGWDKELELIIIKNN